MKTYKQFTKENKEYVDEHGKNVIYDDGEFIISKNNKTSPHYFAIYNNGKVVGNLYLKDSFKIHEGEKYVYLDSVSVDKKFRNRGLGSLLYRLVLKHMDKELSGIVSYLPDRANKRQIPKIYKKFNNFVIDGDYHFIKR